METMEEYKTIRIINEEPEFCEGQKSDILADFFILCEEGETLFGQNIYELKICGMSLVNWVVRVCGKQPKILKIQKGDDALEKIKPYIDRCVDYSVVFFADTPLLNKTHVSDLLEFVDRKRMNVCKLKRGFVFRNDYVMENDEFYSIDEYDFASNDFLQVNDYDTFGTVKEILSQKIIDFHRRNGVRFENEKTVTIDANVKIGEFCKIESGVSLVKGSIIGKNCAVGKNAKITGSKIGDDIRIGDNTVVVDSIIKDNVFVGDDVMIKNSVAGNNVIVEFGSKLSSSSLRDKAVVKSFVTIDEGRIGENSIVQKHCKILGLTGRVIVGHGSEIGANSEIIDSEIAANSFIENGTKITSGVN